MKSVAFFVNIIILSILIVQGCSSSSGPVSNSPGIDPLPNYVINVSKTSGDSEGPLMAFDSTGHLTIGWLETSISNNNSAATKEINSSFSDDGGKTFSIASSETIDKEVSNFKLVHGIEGTIYYLYNWITNLQGISPRPEILFTSNKINKDVLISPIEIPASPAREMAISVADDRTIHLAWSEGSEGKGKIFYSRSLDGGTSFSYKSIPAYSPYMDSDAPLLTVEGSMIANIAWVDKDNSTGDRSIRSTRTTDGGKNFLPIQTLSQNGIDSYCPTIGKDDEGHTVIVWAGTQTINDIKYTDIYASASDGFTFGTSTNIGATYASCPQISTGFTDEIYIVWEEDSDIFFSYSFDRGKTFFFPLNISKSKDRASETPKIVFESPRNINIVWVEQLDSQKEIYYSGSNDGGLNFSIPENISNTDGDSTQPAIGTNGNGNLNVAWTDDSLGNNEIFFRTATGARLLKNTVKDLNGDGYSDIVIGAPGALNNIGRVYIYFGDTAGPDKAPAIELSGIIGKGEFGTSVSIGDVNGDSYSDLLIGAAGAECEGGIVYLFFGRTSESWKTAKSADNADVTFSGDGFDCFGKSVAVDGDVNNDGYNDIIIGAPYGDGQMTNSGDSYLFYGSSNLADSYTTVEGSILKGNTTGDYFGAAVSHVGDINGDGYSDFLIGAPYAEGGKGKVYVYYGGHSEVTQQATLSGNEGERFGGALSRTDDLDRDGFDDFMIGADGGGLQVGKVTLYYGGKNWEDNTSVVIKGTGKEKFGFSIDSLGDVDDKGYSDFIIGAPWKGSTHTGAVYLFRGEDLYGKQGYPNLSINSAALELIGEDKNMELGADVSGAGDVNGDGISDWMAGAGLGGTNYTGIVYFYNGGNITNPSPTILSGKSMDDKFGTSLGKEILP